MSVLHPWLICSFYCDIVEQETLSCLEPIQLNLMHVKERACHTPGTLFCITHFFLPLQALESLLNMLHPRSTINLSFLHLPFPLLHHHRQICETHKHTCAWTRTQPAYAHKHTTLQAAATKAPY